MPCAPAAVLVFRVGAAAVALAAGAAARRSTCGTRRPGVTSVVVGGRGVARRSASRPASSSSGASSTARAGRGPTPTPCRPPPTAGTLRITAAHVGDGSRPARHAPARHPGPRRGPLRPDAPRGPHPPQGPAHGCRHRHHPDASPARGARPGPRRRRRDPPRQRPRRSVVLADEMFRIAAERVPATSPSRGPACPGRDIVAARPGRRTSTDAQALAQLVPDVAERDVFLCGAPAWMDAARRAALDCGVPAEHDPPRAVRVLGAQPCDESPCGRCPP